MQKRFHGTGWLIPVWIRTSGTSLIQCAIRSASDHAAELEVDDPFSVPDRFELLFSPIARSWRECVVISRRQRARSLSISFRGRHLDFGGQDARSKEGSDIAKSVGTAKALGRDIPPTMNPEPAR
jgi:hypothetical protein